MKYEIIILEYDEIFFNVAKHSTLEVLKHQLQELTGILKEYQIIILSDPSDPDRNNDIQLFGNDEPLHELGLRDGSVLSLHSVGCLSECRREIEVSMKVTIINNHS